MKELSLGGSYGYWVVADGIEVSGSAVFINPFLPRFPRLGLFRPFPLPFLLRP